MHTHTHTKEGKGEGSTPHSPFRTRPTTHSFPIATFKIGVSYCEKRNVLRELRKEEIEFVSLMFLGKAFHRMVAI